MAHEYAQDLLEAAVRTAADRDHEIVDYAIDNGFDQIVIGCHSQKRAFRVLYGTVWERVVRHAPDDRGGRPRVVTP